MSLENMTHEEIQFWRKGVTDALDAAAANGLWKCPLCGHLMVHPPCDYTICSHCEVEFGNDAPEYDEEHGRVWKP